jgi:methionyl-tRNA formyltransferase
VRIVYLGTPEAAVPPLRALVDGGHDVAFVVTQPDRRRGRGSDLVPSPVRAAAEELGVPVRTPGRAREVVEELRSSGAQVGVVVAFGQLLPDDVLDALPNGFVNVHFSLLPRWRGAAPVERALLAGDTETGVCVMQIDSGLDTGAVYACATTPIDPTETAGELRARLVALGTDLLLGTLPTVVDRAPQPQVGEPTYADKLGTDEFELTWSNPATDLALLVRGGNPKPGAWFRDGDRRVKVWRAHPDDGELPVGEIDTHARVGTGAGLLVLDEVQPEGKRPMPGTAWRAGKR